ncbi:hypothetical protein DPMN_086804 [Dreissena polymorpha]|uniref:Uncharacterized protein n=1 Tax=Dreissena polymorpha TaxID=45954 RepID=A0A9D4QWB0_DREPO|nr:hypothetical protein DPMN_086804 [Dreissena polymorpha]
MDQYCEWHFTMYYDKDIHQEKSLSQLHAELERRYANTSFFEVDLSDDDVFLFDTGTARQQLKCLKQCKGGRRCFTYTKAGTPCAKIPSLQIVSTDRNLQYRKSSDWPGQFFFTDKDGKRTYNLLNC